MRAMEPDIVSPASASESVTGVSIPSPEKSEAGARFSALEDANLVGPAGPSHGPEDIAPEENRGLALGPANGYELLATEVKMHGSAVGSGPAQSATNGLANGNGHAPVNGHAQSNGHASAHAVAHSTVERSTQTNGNGHANGYGNSHANGHGSGYANWHGNGHAPALHTVLDRNLAERAVRLAPVLAAVGAPAVAVPAVPVLSAVPDSWYVRYGKRVLDVAGALCALVLLSPLMVLSALLVGFDSRGPALYKSVRLGKSGKKFTFYKLRSMYIGADAERARLMHLNEAEGPVFKIQRDPRITRVGRWMRSTSIDELPQLVNVLKGDMSLVGPRPPLPEEAEKYEAWQRRRLDVKPGITCLWQISGRSRLGFHEWMRLDLEYIRRQSLATDLKILLRTVPAVISREGAY